MPNRLISITILYFVLTSSQLIERKEDTSRRIITEGDLKFEFYISFEDISKYHPYLRYYWFKSGKINFSDGGSTGDLLDGKYSKTYRGSFLLEQGEFDLGLKNGTWQEWYKNGQLKEVSNWKNGRKNGVFIQYSEEGKFIVSGKYHKGNKKGVWIDYVRGDTLYFDKGVRIDSPEEKKAKRLVTKEEKGSFFSRIRRFFKKIFSKSEKQNSKKIKKNEAKKKVAKEKTHTKNK